MGLAFSNYDWKHGKHYSLRYWCKKFFVKVSVSLISYIILYCKKCKLSKTSYSSLFSRCRYYYLWLCKFNFPCIPLLTQVFYIHFLSSWWVKIWGKGIDTSKSTLWTPGPFKSWNYVVPLLSLILLILMFVCLKEYFLITEWLFFYLKLLKTYKSASCNVYQNYRYHS